MDQDHMRTNLQDALLPSPKGAGEAGSEEVFKGRREGWGAVGVRPGDGAVVLDLPSKPGQ